MNTLVLAVFVLLQTFAVPKNDTISVYPQNYFSSPLDIPLLLAATFGEPRRLHFHTGFDIRTNQQEGHAVFAVADGYVSRINVSGGGYGNALYITHPNGYVTLYGHLQRFNPHIMERLRKEQYAQKSFAVDFSLTSNEIPVKKGDTIAISGNTGASGGPHLHFEIRDSAERILNPFLFGYNLKDDLKPLVSSLKFYPLDDWKYKCDGYRTKIFLKNGVYEVTGGLVKINSTKVGISVSAYDVMNGTDNHFGIYSIRLYDNGRLLYEYRMDKFAFNEKRYVLSHVDYPVFESEGQKAFHKCFLEPGNKCQLYPSVSNGGMVDLSDDKPHEMKIEVSDYAGNISVVQFKLKHDKTSTLFKEKEFKYTTLFEYNQPNEFSNADIRLKIPTGCLFDNVYFNYSSALTTDANVFSKVHQIDKATTQIFDWFDLSIKTEKLNPTLADKALIVFKDETGAAISRGGKFEKGFITTKAREFGTYFVRLDTTNPVIRPLNIIPGRNMRLYKKILFKISDNLSGIADFDTYLDGQWTLTDYDAKSSTLTHTLDQNLPAGEHTFKVVVTDERTNQSEYSIKFKM